VTVRAARLTIVNMMRILLVLLHLLSHASQGFRYTQGL